MRVIKVEYFKDYKLILTFNDKKVKMVDLEDKLWGPVFEPLKDINLFKEVKLDTCVSICWPNGADICPDVLYEEGKDLDL
jgi:hypothetical protein